MKDDKKEKEVVFVYNYDDSFVYIGKQSARLSPLDKVWLCPAHATFIEPPQTRKDEIAKFDEATQKWSIVSTYNPEAGKKEREMREAVVLEALKSKAAQKLLVLFVDILSEDKTLLEQALAVLNTKKGAIDSNSIIKISAIIEDAKEKAKKVKEVEDPYSLLREG